MAKPRSPVPLLDLKVQHAEIREEIRIALDRVLESQHFILGPEVEAFEKAIASYSQCEFGIGVSSGTDALLVALMAIVQRKRFTYDSVVAVFKKYFLQLQKSNAPSAALKAFGT